MTKTPQQVQRELVYDTLKEYNGSVSKTSRKLGIPYIEVLRVTMPQTTKQWQPTLGPEPADIRTVAKPGWGQYAIAIKRTGSLWPMKYDAVIKDARQKFDAGTHEMFQDNTYGWVVQYLVPRETPTKPRKFFADVT